MARAVPPRGDEDLVLSHVFVATDLLVHHRRGGDMRCFALCGVRIPQGSRGTREPTTCAVCIDAVARGELALLEPRESIDVDVLCGHCGAQQVEELDADANAREALASILCLFCGTVGRFRITTRPTDEERELVRHSCDLAREQRVPPSEEP